MAVKVDCKFIVYNIKSFYLFLPLPLSQASPKKEGQITTKTALKTTEEKEATLKLRTTLKHKESIKILMLRKI